jgi:hypothetical protein
MRIGRRRALVLLGVLVLAAAITAGVQVLWSNDSRSPTLAQLAAHNYRTLSPRESRLLVRFARREYACLASKGTHITQPAVSRTRITMRARGAAARELARLELACDSEVGPPPQGATLQARAEQVLVYLPKGCLIDPTEVSRSA